MLSSSINFVLMCSTFLSIQLLATIATLVTDILVYRAEKKKEATVATQIHVLVFGQSNYKSLCLF
jgi:hypothetical protein